MTANQIEDYLVLKNSIPLANDDQFFEELIKHCKHKLLKKNETLVKYQEITTELYFIVSGSFIRNIITSRGEEKTIMFHTEKFNEYIKAYDTMYFNEKTSYEIRANEKSTVIAIDYAFVYEHAQNNLGLLRYYTQKVEQLFSTFDLFRNLQLALTSEEYLKWLYQNYNFLFQRFPAHTIASFMGITPVWLSKLKAKINS